MPRVCTICTDTRRRRIERDRANGPQSFASLARTYGVGLASLKRHFRNCTAPATKSSAVAAEEDAPAEMGRYDLSSTEGAIGFLRSLALNAKPSEVPGLLTLAAKLGGEFERTAIQPRDVDLKALFGLSDDDVLAIVAEGRARLGLPLPQPPRDLPKPWKGPVTNT